MTENLKSTITYDKLYSFIEQSGKIMSKSEKSYLRTIFDLQWYDEKMILVYIESGFYIANKNKKRFLLHANKFNEVVKKYNLTF